MPSVPADPPAPAGSERRDPSQRIGRTVLDVAQGDYRFESLVVVADDLGARCWRVHLGVPNRAPPAGGFPSFWMLDGNAALIEFDRSLLAELAARPVPPVLVFLGYDNDLRIDLAARTRDYTFVADPRDDGRGGTEWTGGGADIFLDIVEASIQPEIAWRERLDPARQTLWGQSLGGLLALYALFSRRGMFRTFAAASPSLWWHGGALLGEPAQRFTAHGLAAPARLLLSLGGREREPDFSDRDMNDPRVAAHLARVAAVPPDSAYRLAQRLREVPGLDVEYREFPGLGHGPMFRASLMAALHAVTGIADRSATPRPPEP